MPFFAGNTPSAHRLNHLPHMPQMASACRLFHTSAHLSILSTPCSTNPSTYYKIYITVAYEAPRPTRLQPHIFQLILAPIIAKCPLGPPIYTGIYIKLFLLISHYLYHRLLAHPSALGIAVTMAHPCGMTTISSMGPSWDGPSGRQYCHFGWTVYNGLSH